MESCKPWPWSISEIEAIEMKNALLIGLFAVLSATATADTIEMKVYGLVCGFCAQGIEKTLRKNPATEDVVVSLEDKLVAISTRPGQDIPDAELTKALTESGYDVKGISRTQRSMTDIRTALKKGAK
jgi:copper chaperone CopZ